jgi:hypothetical protein
VEHWFDDADTSSRKMWYFFKQGQIDALEVR